MNTLIITLASSDIIDMLNVDITGGYMLTANSERDDDCLLLTKSNIEIMFSCAIVSKGTVTKYVVNTALVTDNDVKQISAQYDSAEIMLLMLQTNISDYCTANNLADYF